MSLINTINSPANHSSALREPTSTAVLRPDADSGTVAETDFARVFKTLLAGVNQSQQQAAQAAKSFETGQEQDLAGVMIAQQKARLTFQTTLQVRNKVVSAYQDIMNMPI